ncbi:MAG: type II secretion system F family protein [Oscillospiraceae bacterium]|nr:type II secretion system F family protein [Oscillospiraceae bacterium]
MTVYRYEAVNRKGEYIRDSMEAASPEAARASLRSVGYTVVRLRPRGQSVRLCSALRSAKPAPEDMAMLCHQTVSILRAGVPVSEAFSLLARQTESRALAAVLRMVHSDLETGRALADAMRRHPAVFSEMFVSLAAAGEASGTLENTFRQMARYFETSSGARSELRRLMIYPCFLFAVMLAVLAVMMLQIIPSFLQTFDELNVELPALTRVVVAAGEWLGDWCWALGAGAALAVIAAVLFRRTENGRRCFDAAACRLPFLGALTVRAAVAAFCRTLSLLLASGLTLLDALELAAGSMGNVCFAEAVRRVRGLVAEGWPLGASLREVRLFPPVVSGLAGVGEESGDLAGMLEKLADYYDAEVRNTTHKLLALLEPASILFMAVLVAILVFSIFLPILSMTSAYDQYL